MKIQKDFCDLTRFLQVNTGLKCREKCHNCKKKWSDTKTEAVSRAVSLEKINGRFVETVSYLCSSCADLLSSNGVQSIPSECK